MRRRGLLLVGLGASLAATPAGRAVAQSHPPPPRGSWFDPTQLPSFTGTVERWLIDPAGSYDRLLFREGAQVVFPPHLSEPMREAAHPGQPITVWGVRARNAPVVTMLAWSADPDGTPNFVDRPAWFTPTDLRGTEPLQAAGNVRAPLLSPQGDTIGAILDDGSVLRMAPEVAAEHVAAGRHLAAAGLGSRRDGVVAFDVARLGSDADRMTPVAPSPAPPAEPRR